MCISSCTWTGLNCSGTAHLLVKALKPAIRFALYWHNMSQSNLCYGDLLSDVRCLLLLLSSQGTGCSRVAGAVPTPFEFWPMERSDGNRPGSGGSRPGSRGALGIAEASISVKESLEILQNASKSSEKALEVLKEARAAVASMKEASAKFEQTVAEAEKTCQKGSSLDEKWEEFKAKFEALNRMAVEKIMGLGGGSSSDLRPADRISVARVAQVLRRSQNLVVLTGAGISAESGIPTFRGADGFWTVGSKHYQPQELATWEKYNEMPAELWRWYQYRWGICRKAKPNPGHTSVVELQRLAEGDFMLVTQNVDGLHLQAGTDRSKVCEIHGRIDEMRCDERIEGSCLYKLDLNNIANLDRARATVMPTPEPAKDEKEECLPLCPKCGVRQRPKILWFDETYDEAFFKWNTVMEKMERCDVLLIVGTQLTTGGPRSMVRAAQKAGAIIIRVDPEVDLKDDSTAGMLHLQGCLGELLGFLLPLHHHSFQFHFASPRQFCSQAHWLNSTCTTWPRWLAG